MLANLVGSLLLPKDEKAVLDAARGFLAQTMGASMESSFEDIVGQLKGELPMASATHKVLEFLRKGAESPLWSTAVGAGMDTLASKGFNPEAVANLVTRFAKMVGVNPHLEGAPTERVALTLGSIATGATPEYAPVIGALVVCPQCHYTHLI